MKTIYFTLAIVFWPLYYIVIELNQNPYIEIATLFFLTTPALLLILKRTIEKRALSMKFLPQHLFFIFVFLSSLQMLFSDPSTSLLSQISNFANVFFIAFFWFNLDKFVGRDKTNLALFLSSGIVLFVLLLPQYYLGFSLNDGIIGSVKNSGYQVGGVKFVKSTVEIYFWTGIFFSILLTKKKTLLKYLFILFLSLFIIASGKRSLLIFYFLTLLLSQINFIRKNFGLYSYFIPLLPVIFYFFNYLLIPLLFKNDLIYSLFVTTSLENFQTASGRLIMWNDLVVIFFSFDFAHLFNGVKNFSFWKYFDNPIYFNLHNTYLQVFYQQGYLFFIFVLLIFWMYLRLMNYGFKNKPQLHYKARSYLILLVLIFSNTEALLRIETTHCLIAVTILSLRND